MLHTLQTELKHVQFLHNLTQSVIAGSDPRFFSVAVYAMRCKRIAMYSQQIAQLKEQITTMQTAELLINSNVAVVVKNGLLYI